MANINQQGQTFAVNVTESSEPPAEPKSLRNQVRAIGNRQHSVVFSSNASGFFSVSLSLVEVGGCPLNYVFNVFVPSTSGSGMLADCVTSSDIELPSVGQLDPDQEVTIKSVGIVGCPSGTSLVLGHCRAPPTPVLQPPEDPPTQAALDTTTAAETTTPLPVTTSQPATEAETTTAAAVTTTAAATTTLHLTTTQNTETQTATSL
mmetsp:Transcript_59529/g.129416  ORF Transcript_59529/g.129416 Transcript_59529/m.129416 type:complete len:205 (-) Transcript_59529:31-645(-)